MLLAFVMMVGMLVPAIGSAAEYESTDFKVDYYGKEEPEESEELFSQPLNDGNFCAIKQGSGYVIVWSEDALTEDERAAIEGVVKAKDPSTVGAQFFDMESLSLALFPPIYPFSFPREKPSKSVPPYGCRISSTNCMIFLFSPVW